jgi:hypothetical protein
MSSPARDVSCTVTVTLVPEPFCSNVVVDVNNEELSSLSLNDVARNDALVWIDRNSRDAAILGIAFVVAAEDIDPAFTEVDFVIDESRCF